MQPKEGINGAVLRIILPACAVARTSTPEPTGVQATCGRHGRSGRISCNGPRDLLKAANRLTHSTLTGQLPRKFDRARQKNLIAPDHAYRHLVAIPRVCRTSSPSARGRRNGATTIIPGFFSFPPFTPASSISDEGFSRPPGFGQLRAPAHCFVKRSGWSGIH